MSHRGVALLIVRIPYQSTTAVSAFNAVELLDRDDEFGRDERVEGDFVLKSPWRNDVVRQVTLSTIHTARYGFLFQISGSVEMSVGDLLTNSNRLAKARLVDVKFRLTDEAGKVIELSEEFMPEVIRGAGFAGVCMSLERGNEGRFLLFNDVGEIAGPVTIDGLESESTIRIAICRE